MRGLKAKNPAARQVRSLASQVRLDARTKLLNPKWYEGMLSSGYEGVREIQKRLTNTMGWSATAGAVDGWVYDEANATFIDDPDMAKRHAPCTFCCVTVLPAAQRLRFLHLHCACTAGCRDGLDLLLS